MSTLSNEKMEESNKNQLKQKSSDIVIRMIERQIIESVCWDLQNYFNLKGKE